MTAEERMQLMKNDLIEGHLSTAEIADKYFNCATSALRDSLISQLETLRQLYSTKHSLKKVLND